MLIPELAVDVSKKTTAEVDYKIAATQDERASAFRLVHNSYVRAGLGESNEYKMRVTPYHLLPTTEVFIAVCEGETIFTVSLVADGELGLPMESIYAREVALRREQGLLVAEVSCLADRRDQLRGFFPVFLRLSRLMAQYARKRGLHQLLVAVHPKHARFYQRFLHFQPIGREKAYPTVRNHPAIALGLDFGWIERERPETHDRFFGQPLPDEQLRPQPISMAECDFFRPALDPSFDLVLIGEADYGLATGAAELAVNVA